MKINIKGNFGEKKGNAQPRGVCEGSLMPCSGIESLLGILCKLILGW